MKNKTTTLLAVTLITLLTASQSAMALSEDTSGYNTLSSTSESSQSIFVTASFMQQGREIGNSENGIDPAYLGGTYMTPYSNQEVTQRASHIFASDTNK